MRVLQAAGNRNYCAVATQSVSKRNPCWPGWRPAGGRGQCVYACHRALESSMAQTDASDFYNIDCIVQGVIVIVSSNLISSLENYTSRMAFPDFVTVTFNLLFVPL